MRILYVEDNPANVFLVKRVARMGQHEIINYIDGGEALRKFEAIKPDLVLMDIQLVGDTTGLEVVKQLRAKGIQTPIVAVTAYAMVGDKERCLEAGCNDYLAKPMPIPRLVELFQQYDTASAKAASDSPDTKTTSKDTSQTPSDTAAPQPTTSAKTASTTTDETSVEAKTPSDTGGTADTQKDKTPVEVKTPSDTGDSADNQKDKTKPERPAAQTKPATTADTTTDEAQSPADPTANAAQANDKSEVKTGQ